MPEQYREDIWNIREWDIYKTATQKQKNIWHRHASLTKDKIDFTPCNNLYIREELKYVMYVIIIKGTKISTLGSNYDFLKTLISYINKQNKSNSISTTDTLNSLIDLEHNSYESYISVKLGRKTTGNERNYINKDMKQETIVRKKPVVTFFYRCIKILKDYRNKDIPLMDRDIWKKEQVLSINPTGKFKNNLDFSSIEQEPIKRNVKEFCRYKLAIQQNITVVQTL